MNDERSDSADLPETDGLYPIRTVSALSGVNPVTLRAWERRYGLITPKRTPKGHRLYSAADVELIQRIVALLDQGIPISQTKRLLNENATSTAPMPEPSAETDPWSSYRQRVAGAIERFDDRVLDAVYNDALSVYPMDLVTRHLLLPLFHDLRERTRTEPVSLLEQGFLNTYLRNKLGARFHHLSTQPRGPKLLVGTLPGDATELEALLFGIAAITHGFRVLHLGTDIPLGALEVAVGRSGCQAVVLYASGHSTTRFVYELLARLATQSAVPIFLGGEIGGRYAAELESIGIKALARDTAGAMQQLDSSVTARQRR